METTGIYLHEMAGEREDALVLVVQNGIERGRSIRITRFPCLLGRGSNCDVKLEETDDPPGISRQHCRFHLYDGAILVEDISTNGTYIGSRRLEPGMAVALPVGGQIRIGPTLELRCTAIPVTVKPADRNLCQRNSEDRTREAQSSGDQNSETRKSGERKLEVAPGRQPLCPVGAFRKGMTTLENLRHAWEKVYLNRGAAGPDGVTVLEFAIDSHKRLRALAESIRNNSYRPMPPRLFAAPKRNGGVRTIAILNVQDRIVQQAMHSLLQDHIEPRLPQSSYAYRTGVGSHTAVGHVERLLGQGLHWIVESDIASFFDTISHRIMLDMLGRVVPDPFILGMMAQAMAAGAVAPGLGLAQGAATSPLLSNLYLSEFDHAMLAAGWNPVRYGDDLIFACATRNEAQAALAEAEGYLRTKLQLALNANKTRVTALEQGFIFLGFHFSHAGRRPSPEAMERLEERLQATDPDEQAVKLRQWGAYFGAGVKPTLRATSEWDEEMLERYRALFVGREACYARQGREGKRRTFVPCQGTVNLEQIRQHIAGQEALAGYLLLSSGKVRQLVLDIDGVLPPGRPKKFAEIHNAKFNETSDENSKAMMEEMNAKVSAFALALVRVCRRFGVPYVLVDSGRRGRHLWLLFSEEIEVDMARRLGRLLAKRAGFPENVEGCRLEILPRHSEWVGEELGDAIALPFGIHPLSGRRCFLLDEEGKPVGDMTRGVAQIRTIPVGEVQKIVTQLSLWRDEPAYESVEVKTEPERGGASKELTSPVERLVEGCGVIRGIMRRAQETGHLRHTHQLILLYTAGHLGAEGQRFIHETILHCRNYDPGICQRYIDKLEVAHPPISCRRIREWLEEEETGWCRCERSRRSPLTGISQAVGTATSGSSMEIAMLETSGDEVNTVGEVNELQNGVQNGVQNEVQKEGAKPKRRSSQHRQRVPDPYLKGEDWDLVVGDIFERGEEGKPKTGMGETEE